VVPSVGGSIDCSAIIISSSSSLELLGTKSQNFIFFLTDKLAKKARVFLYTRMERDNHSTLSDLFVCEMKVKYYDYDT